MRIIHFTGLILFMFAGFHSLAQTDPLLVDPILVRLKGRLVSAADSSGIPYANIVNPRYRGAPSPMPTGIFPWRH